jgi:predicted membrane chloride channel (bestrophin family)
MMVKNHQVFISLRRNPLAMGRLDDGFVGKDMHVNAIYNSLGDILEYSSVLEDKNTPIPLSYVLHIKISILIYLFTLPFGMFHARSYGHH